MRTTDVELFPAPAHGEMALIEKLNSAAFQERSWAVSTPISKSNEARGTSAFPTTQRIEALEGEASEKPANSVFAHVMLGCVLGVLFAVAITSPVRPKDETAQNQPVSHQTASQSSTSAAAIAAPEVRDLGSFSSGPGGLTGHLVATWSDKLSYRLDIGPSDPALSDAFAYTVADTHSPLPVSVELRNSSGQMACDQQLVVKPESNTESHKPAVDVNSSTPVVAEGAFQNVLGKDGKVGSIAAQGIMPCTKQAFDSVAAWSFAAQFPDLREQAALMQRRAAERVVAKSSAPQAHPLMKAPEHHPLTASLQSPTPSGPKSVTPPSAPAVAPVTQPVPPQLAETASAPQPFQFAVEGDDEIVDVDASQRSIQTTAGKVFLVREQLAAADGDGVLDELANIHYRCDQSASCTLSLSDATVLHATLRTHHATSQSTELSMSDSQTQSSSQTQISSLTQISSSTLDAPQTQGSQTAGGLEGFGR